MNSIAVFKSSMHGKAELFPDRIVIEKSSVGIGRKKNKTIYLNRLDGINLEKAGLKQGYIHFSTGGSSMKNKYNDLIKDENTIVFGMQGNGKATKFKTAVEEQMGIAHSANAQVVTASTPADEIAKYNELLQQGVITAEEFEQKKKQLLGL